MRVYKEICSRKFRFMIGCYKAKIVHNNNIANSSLSLNILRQIKLNMMNLSLIIDFQNKNSR